MKKACPEERVGVFAQQGDGVAVVEYRQVPQYSIGSLSKQEQYMQFITYLSGLSQPDAYQQHMEEAELDTALQAARLEEATAMQLRMISRPSVCWHSELDPSQASARDPATGELLFGWSNVCMHWFAVVFLRTAAERLQREAAYHVARKQIPSVNGPVKVLSVGHIDYRAYNEASAEEWSGALQCWVSGHSAARYMLHVCNLHGARACGCNHTAFALH